MRDKKIQMRVPDQAGTNCRKQHRLPAGRRRLPAFGLVLMLAAGGVRGEDELWEEYQEVVRPVLEAHCYDCHGNGNHKGSIELDTFRGLADVLADDWTWELVHKQVGGYAMPPKDKPQPTVAQRQAVTEWIERVLYPVDCDHPDPGRVTLRRLNRVEYDLTIRDLVRVDVHAGEDFPPDDTGYGFDNIADVLTLSPLLMEKYLAAAEAILDRALVTGPPAPPRQAYPANQLRGGAPSEGMRGLSSQGEIVAEHVVGQGGRMRIEVMAGEDPGGDEPARMRLSVNGEVLDTVAVTAPRERPHLYTVEFTAEPGPCRVAAEFINDYYNPEAADRSRRDRNLYVAGIEVIGPLDLPPPPLPESHRRIMICTPDETTPPEVCVRKILAAFTRRAYRRPPRDWELDRLASLAGSILADGGSLEQAIQLALQAVLVSPQFLFRSVEPPPGMEDTYAIDEYALASRLSYFLWSTMPDEELLGLAEQGRLRAELPVQVARMLQDPKADALSRHFAGQWLQTRNLALADPAPERFPAFDEALRTAMAEETRQFFACIQQEDRSVLEFLDADYTFVNQRLAEHYGIPGVEGDTFRRVTLSDRRRGGLLTQAGILTITSNPNRTSPVKRGKWVLDNLLGTPPPPPPENVPALPDSAPGEGARSQRELLAEHRANPVCASCHTMMDPIGFSLEHYDGIGVWRDDDAGLPIDASGSLVSGESFDGMQDLRTLLVTTKRELFTKCLVRQMLTYALGRGLTPADRCAVDRISAAMEQGDFRFSVLVQGIIDSVPFQQARREEGGHAPTARLIPAQAVGLVPDGSGIRSEGQAHTTAL